MIFHRFIVILRPLPHDIAILGVGARLRTLIFETLTNHVSGGTGIKNTVFLQGAQNNIFFRFWGYAVRDQNIKNVKKET